MKSRTISVFLLLFVTSFLHASKPAIWRLASQEDFEKGTFKGVALTSDGRLIHAPAIQLEFDSKQPFIYCAEVDSRGNVALGTGNDGKIYLVSPDGQGRELVDLDEPGVQALAFRQSGELLAAGNPGGKVYRILPDGSSSVFFDPQEKYIWDLLLDSRGTLFVATGPHGRIFSVDPQGRAKTFYDGQEEHIVDLAQDAEGNLLAGSTPGGLLTRFNAEGKPYVLYDSTLEEIRAIRTDRYGNIYAIGISYVEGGKESPKTAAKKTSEKKESEDESQETVSIEGIKKGSRLELYKIDRENLVELLYSQDTQGALDLLVRENGEVLLGTSQKGRLLAITSDRLKKVLGEAPGDQITRILRRQDQILLTTSNLGGLYRLSRDAGDKGSYESEVLDGEVVSAWGRIRRRGSSAGETGLTFSTRSGNTEKPDDSWSQWSPVEGDGTGGAIQSSSARFLQWKADFVNVDGSGTLFTEKNSIEAVEISYLQKNVAPEIESITLHAPGSALVDQPVSNQMNAALGGPDDSHLRSLPASIRKIKQTPTAPPREIFTPAARSVSWKATDVNDDDIVFDVYLRPLARSSWSLLEKGREESYYTLDGASVPDGIYLFKVVASDRLSNPPGNSLESEILSKPFAIAKRLPSIEITGPERSGNSSIFRVVARTEISEIYQLEYTLDGRSWMISYPDDGIADSPMETYTLSTETLHPGNYSLAVRAVDSLGNLGTASLDFKTE